MGAGVFGMPGFGGFGGPGMDGPGMRGHGDPVCAEARRHCSRAPC